jgi:hypothetical protein
MRCGRIRRGNLMGPERFSSLLRRGVPPPHCPRVNLLYSLVYGETWIMLWS